MIQLKRYPGNPILVPSQDRQWEHDGAFNGCVIAGQDNKYHIVYRALSSHMRQNGADMRVSSIGYSQSDDGMLFGEHKQIIKPEEDWEIYGCEDPRITYLEGKYYICYTALSVYPFSAYGIKLACATTTDFKAFEKHPVTSFNSKAMAIFPQRINGKIAAILTMNTDLPPAKMAIAYFDREEDMWSPYYWDDWYENCNNYIIHLLRDMRDQVELGSPPVYTKDGWLVLYSYITNYLSNNKLFGVEAVLLDLENPRHILGRTNYSLISPTEDYEIKGDVPNIVFPSGALIKDDQLYVYYGAADTRCCLATVPLEELLADLRPKTTTPPVLEKSSNNKSFTRYSGNPILTPIPELDWQNLGTYNPAAIYLDGKVYIVYRGQSTDGTSVMGLAISKDGFHIDENFDEPIYYPHESFEKKIHQSGNSGCEDPRITQIDDKLFMTYTAYDGVNPPRVALTSIVIDDFLNKRWYWEKARLISLPGVDDKDACIIKGKMQNQYLAFHRLGEAIWIDESSDAQFHEEKCLTGKILALPRRDKWDNAKIGIASPPMELSNGWLLLYHGVTQPGGIYKVGAMLLDLNDPSKVLARTDSPIFEPEADYELYGQIPNVVFPCGSVIIDKNIFIYYGGADSVTGVATMPVDVILSLLTVK